MVERAHEEDRQAGDALAVGSRGEVGRERHFRDVELAPAHHSPERVDERVDLDEIEFETSWFHGSILERLIVALRAGDGLQLGPGHEFPSPSNGISNTRTRCLPRASPSSTWAARPRRSPARRA